MNAQRQRRIPPGPRDPYDPKANPLHWMAENFEQFGDIFKASIHGRDTYVVRHPKYVERVLLKNWSNYVKGQAIKRIAFLLGKGIMVSEGKFWKSQRRMIQPAFRQEVIAGLTGLIARTNQTLLTDWERAAQRGQVVDVTSDVSHMVMQFVLASIFGNDVDAGASAFEVLSVDPARDLEFIEKFRSLTSVVRDIMQRRRERGALGTDFLGMLMAARARETGLPMPDTQIVNEVMTLVVAGHETTASTINWTWYLLSQHPDVEQRLTAELERLPYQQKGTLEELDHFVYTRRILEEAMRLYPAGWLLTRRALNDDWLDDFFVPARTEIYIPIYFIQRHPDLWVEPDRFNPDRFTPENSVGRHPLAMLPFSVGPRNCIGEQLARTEMQMHLMMIAKRLRFQYNDAKTPELELGINLRSKNNFLMTPSLKGGAARGA